MGREAAWGTVGHCPHATETMGQETHTGGGPKLGFAPCTHPQMLEKRGGAAQGPPIGENIINNIRNK